MTEKKSLPKDFDGVVRNLEIAKKREEDARELRIRLEGEVCAMLHKSQLWAAPDEGSKTFKSDEYKVVLTAKLNRKFNEDVWSEIAEDFPGGTPPVRQKLELDLTKFRALEKSHPALFRLACRAVTETPGKTAVSVERVK